MSKSRITNIQDFLDLQDNHLNDDEIWYRGHSDAAWNLTPSIFREADYTVAKAKAITALFKQNASMLISEPPNEIDWMFIMQHHNVPTRLLDWSENPLVALFFAVNDKDKFNCDGCLWLLKPKKLNQLAIGIGTIPLYSDDALKDHTNENRSTYDKQPAALLAVRNNARLQIQEGVFTIHSENVREIKDEIEYLEKIMIPSQSKEHIKMQLAILGINEFRLFPELSNIKTIIKHKGLLK